MVQLHSNAKKLAEQECDIEKQYDNSEVDAHLVEYLEQFLVSLISCTVRGRNDGIADERKHGGRTRNPVMIHAWIVVEVQGHQSCSTENAQT